MSVRTEEVAAAAPEAGGPGFRRVRHRVEASAINEYRPVRVELHQLVRTAGQNHSFGFRGNSRKKQVVRAIAIERRGSRDTERESHRNENDHDARRMGQGGGNGNPLRRAT